MSERNLPILRTEAAAVLCSICPDPGHCCRRFYYHKSFWKDEGLEAAQAQLTTVPFEIIDWQPQVFQDDGGREYAAVICKCPKVTSEGKCSIYNDRPWTCRVYEPGSDGLCVFRGSEGIKFWQ